jgi:hypothetical protein
MPYRYTFVCHGFYNHETVEFLGNQNYKVVLFSLDRPVTKNQMSTEVFLLSFQFERRRDKAVLQLSVTMMS